LPKFSGSKSGEPGAGGKSEFEAALEGDHARGAITAQADTEEASWRRGRGVEGAETSLGRRISWDAGQHAAWKRKVRMVENVETLNLDSQF